jgi:hypothetical protein
MDPSLAIAKLAEKAVSRKRFLGGVEEPVDGEERAHAASFSTSSGGLGTMAR